VNLNDNPSLDELKEMFASCNDDAGHHVLWVDKSGEVNLSVIPKDLTQAAFQEETTQMQIRYEAFIQGSKYVGISASKDQSFMEKIYDNIRKNWASVEEKVVVVNIDEL
jgi:hypothetical protein